MVSMRLSIRIFMYKIAGSVSSYVSLDNAENAKGKFNKSLRFSVKS